MSANEHQPIYKLRDLEQAVRAELMQEEVDIAKEVIKERLREIRQAKKIVAKLEKQYQELLDRDVTDDIDE